MSQLHKQNDPLEYAEKYSKPSLSEADYLITRDVSGLIKQYVTGNLALDYGCGPGLTTRYLKSLGFNVESVDINPHMLEKAKHQDPSGKYELIKSGEILRDDNHYDLVYASWVLPHAKTKEELLKILEDIFRVLKKGGTLIVVGNSDDSFKYEWLTCNSAFEENQNLTSGSIAKVVFKVNNFTLYDYYWSEKDYREAIEKAGLTVARVHKPMGNDTDGFAWINEKVKAYAAIFVAQKL